MNLKILLLGILGLLTTPAIAEESAVKDLISALNFSATAETQAKKECPFGKLDISASAVHLYSTIKNGKFFGPDAYFSLVVGKKNLATEVLTKEGAKSCVQESENAVSEKLNLWQINHSGTESCVPVSVIPGMSAVSGAAVVIATESSLAFLRESDKVHMTYEKRLNGVLKLDCSYEALFQ